MVGKVKVSVSPPHRAAERVHPVGHVAIGEPGLVRPQRQRDRHAGRERRAVDPVADRAAADVDRGDAALDGGDAAVQEIALAEEIGDEASRRPLVELLRRAELHHLAVAHDGDAIRHDDRLLLVVRHVDESGAETAMQVAQLELQLGAQLLVERRHRLVEEEDARLEDEGAGQRHALLLAARKLRRHAVGEAAELHEIERRLDALARLGFGHAADAQGIEDVLRHAHMRKEGIALEDDAEIALLGRQVGDRHAVQPDDALGRLHEAGDRHQYRRLARAGGAEQGDELAGGDGERHVVDRLDVPVVLRQPFEGDGVGVGHRAVTQRRGAARSPRSGVG